MEGTETVDRGIAAWKRSVANQQVQSNDIYKNACKQARPGVRSVRHQGFIIWTERHNSSRESTKLLHMVKYWCPMVNQ